MLTFRLNKVVILLVQGDITEANTDAIVNAANSFLKHGGGVAAAIVRKGGYQIQRESDEYIRRHGPVPTGSIAITSAGNLKAKYVIHAVGPRYGEENGDLKLASAIKSSLLKADELGLKSIALPAISTGVFGYPYEKCAEIMVKEIIRFSDTARNLKRIVIYLYGERAYNVFKEVFKKHIEKYLQ